MHVNNETTSSMLESFRNKTKMDSKGEINEILDFRVYFRERRKQIMFTRFPHSIQN